MRRGFCLLGSADSFCRRHTRETLQVEGWSGITYANVERDEGTEIRDLDQRSWGGAFGELAKMSASCH